MSFFGFDPSGPPSKDDLKTYDFEETYEGLGEHPEEEDDALNAETFGDDVYVGKDFNFGNASEESAPKSAEQPKLSYAKAALQPVDEILQPMASLWGSSDATQEQQQQKQQQPSAFQQPPVSQDDRVLSMEEIEAQLLGESGAQAQLQPQMSHQQMFPPPPGAYPNFMIPPGAPPRFQPPPMMYNNQSFPYPPPPMGVPPQFQQQMPPPQQQRVPSNQYQGPPQNMLPPQPQAQQEQQLQQQQQQHFQQQPHPQFPGSLNAVSQNQKQDPRKLDLTQFPVLGSPEAEGSGPGIPAQQQQQHHQQQQQNQQAPPQHFQQQQIQNQQQQQHSQQRLPSQFQQRSYQNQPRAHYHSNNHHDLSPEERERFLRRQEKVARIFKDSGIMNPRDKDYVTRFQLSQIISEDPYNEDFYYQVFKVLNNQGTNHIDGMSSIAQNYLEQSGHRLGGKHKRADVALQRMQQQVSKAVTVAKERGPKQGILTREGALGKVSFGTVKQPRTTLVIKAKEGDIEINSDHVPHPPAELKFSKSSRKFHLYLIEKLYGITLRYESMERENIPVDNAELIDTIFNKEDSSDDSFVYIFNYDKGMNLFPRFFRFLSYEQKLNVITLIFKNLQKTDVILKSSYKNYEDSIIPSEINKRIDLFQVNILKNLVLFLSEAKFSEVLNLLIVILTQNNLVFLCTTRIGLSFITISISRLELIKQEFGSNLSPDDLSTWTNVYDRLFEQLEGRLTEIFPPSLSSASSEQQKKSHADDSYIWQFLAALALAGKLSQQRVIVDEIRDEIFGVQSRAKNDLILGNYEDAAKRLGNLNLFLNVMGLKATEDDISELK